MQTIAPNEMQRSHPEPVIDTNLPSYADLNSLQQFNFPPGYVDLKKLTISNNLKVTHNPQR